MAYKSKYFNLKTDPHMACSCCGKYLVTDRLLMTLDAIREGLGKAVTIVCAYRCPKHNAELPHSVPNSGHITGEAADITVKGMTRTALFEAIKVMYKQGHLPYLEYCYSMPWSRASVHVGVDKKKRSSHFGA